jgi:hypothetical protein
MKIWCTLNRNPANKWSESCALWSSFPVADVSKLFLEKLLIGHCGLQIGDFRFKIKNFKCSIKEPSDAG